MKHTLSDETLCIYLYCILKYLQISVLLSTFYMAYIFFIHVKISFPNVRESIFHAILILAKKK